MDRESASRARMKRNKRRRRFRLYVLIVFLVTLSVLGIKFMNRSKNEPIPVEGLTKEEVMDEVQALSPLEDIAQEVSSDSEQTPILEEDLSEENLDDSGQEVSHITEHRNLDDLGDIESIIDYGDNGLIGVHYPVFGKNKVDAISKELVTGYIEDFKRELNNNAFLNEDYIYELSIDYETHSAPNNIVSITFDVSNNSSYLAHPDVKVVTKVYDLSNDREVVLDSFMKEGYLTYISQISQDYFSGHDTYKNNVDSSLFNEGIYPSIENYANYILKEDKIVFIFEKYQLFSGNFGSPSIEITYSDLKDYLKAELFEVFTTEEVSNKDDEDMDKPAVDITFPRRVIDPSKPMIALTFDDGPNKKTTLPILDTLKEYDGVATFFILGNRVSDNVSILERMLEEGSEIGNHSYNHKELTKLSPQALQEQLVDTQNVIHNSTGIEPKFMRPTYGSYNKQLKSSVGMPLILWSIDTLDWKSRDARMVTDHVLENVRDGDVVLMHDIYDSTAEAVRLLVPELIDRGYQLVTVSELFEVQGQPLKDGHIYNRMYK